MIGIDFNSTYLMPRTSLTF